MSSIDDLNMKKISSTGNKYHTPVICNIDEGGYYYGSYYDKSFKLTGFFQAETHEEMLKQCYDSFTMCMRGEEKFPFNVDDIENAVVFDEVKCETEEEMDLAYDIEEAGQGFIEIMEAINQ
ncbi:unnamed protein product [Adineta steineri]|uniref:Uncharacterized protein n=1 Tax=Adineta steineri TaxID=433720 RepID=A0A815MJE6_9BILA|nr:unnamed protein product [Adineta steineri]CAF4007937.1 unnamed protein product [Adineta steineri]